MPLVCLFFGVTCKQQRYIHSLMGPNQNKNEFYVFQILVIACLLFGVTCKRQGYIQWTKPEWKWVLSFQIFVIFCLLFGVAARLHSLDQTRIKMSFMFSKYMLLFVCSLALHTSSKVTFILFWDQTRIKMSFMFFQILVILILICLPFSTVRLLYLLSFNKN